MSELDPNVQPTGPGGSVVPRVSRRVIGAIFLFAALVLGGLVYAVLQRAAPPPPDPEAAAPARLAALPAPPPDVGSLVPGYEPQLVEVPAAPIPEPDPAPLTEPLGPPPLPPALAERRQRIEDQRQELYRDALLAPTVVAVTAAPPAPPTAAIYRGDESTRRPAAIPAAGEIPTDPNLRTRKDAFSTADHSPEREPLYTIPPSPTATSELRAGTILPALLITGLNSDLPGQLVAQVSRDVRDTLSGDHVLVPAGSRLIGTYDSHVAFGQRRALVAWSSIQLPDGSTVPLGNMPGADPTGLSGFADRVDNHYWRTFAGATLLSVISAGAQLSQPDRAATTVDGRPLTAEEQLAAELGRQWSEVGEQLVTRGLDTQPTLTIRPGYRFRVIVTRDVVLPPWRG